MEFATGGNATAFLTFCLLTTVATTALYSSISGAYSNCHWEPYIKEVRTPFYDPISGKHMNKVDTYKDHRWVCV